MKALGAIVLMALLAAGATSAHHKPEHGESGRTDENHGFITREWVWSDATTRTTFTAYGPPGQVNRLDPRDGTPECHNCELASSIEILPIED
jgi:hypothetical protein